MPHLPRVYGRMPIQGGSAEYESFALCTEKENMKDCKNVVRTLGTTAKFRLSRFHRFGYHCPSF